MISIRTLRRWSLSALVAGTLVVSTGCLGFRTNSNIEPDFIPNDLSQLADQMESAVSVAQLGFSVLEIYQRSTGTDPAVLEERRVKFENSIEMINMSIAAIRELDEAMGQKK